MKTRVLSILLALFAITLSAQHGGKDHRKHGKEMHKKEMEWQKEQHKKEAEHYREMAKNEQEYYREISKREKQYHKELRKAHLEHLKACSRCDHGFYHNNDHYYERDVYYSRRDRTPVRIDAEMVFRNGSVRISL